MLHYTNWRSAQLERAGESNYWLCLSACGQSRVANLLQVTTITIQVKSEIIT